MIYDIHTHIPGFNAENGNYVSDVTKRQITTSIFLKSMGLHRKDLLSAEIDTVIMDKYIKWIQESMVDKIVILAFDGVYSRDGKLDMKKTRIITDNDYVASIASKHDKIMFGASIHPYRKNAVYELERLIDQGACLVKWLPVAQGIQPDAPICLDFYHALAKNNIPLLCHIGCEHTAPVFDKSLNDPYLLKPALDVGATVIGAHCGTKIHMFEKDYFKRWRQMALEYDNFYGDLSAFSVPTRIRVMKKIMADPKLLSKVVYGSDFPALTISFFYLFQLGIKEVSHLLKVKNPIDKAYLALKKMGLPDEVFTRAGKILKFTTSDK